MPIDWKSIRPLQGGREKGFEELCAQLARAARPSRSEFVRKGTPDAGVECYAILTDGTEWAWQSKYVDGLGDSQWLQIDRSVATALEKHPKLVRYFVCAPVDRADARVEGRRYAKDRWDSHVEKWSGWASDRGMTVEFTYWGSHELLEILARPEHLGRVRFWFDVQGFDAPWFTARLDEALQAAGPRYTPEVHVDLRIAREFEAFGRTDRFFDREKARALKIREKLRSVEYSARATDPAVDTALSVVSSEVHTILTAIGAMDAQATGHLPLGALAEQVQSVKKTVEEPSRLLAIREREWEREPETKDAKTRRSPYASNPFRDRRTRLRHLTSELEAARRSFVHAAEIGDGALLVLMGRAGTGKTHLLCDVARSRISAGRPTVLLMGQRFVSNEEPWSQALQQMDLSRLSVEEFVGALEAAAQAADSRALVMIDGINEGSGLNIWRRHLAAFLTRLERSPWIGVVLSVRSSFEKLVLPSDVRSRAAVVTHAGFRGHEYDAAKKFFIHYGLELPSTPLLAPEFQNPLFLKTLCLGLNARGERRLPRGSRGITSVFALYLDAINERLASSLDFDPETRLVRQAVDTVAGAIIDSGDSWLPSAEVKSIVNRLLPGRDFGRSLYRGLVVEGVLVEGGASAHDTTDEVVVFIAYDRLADHVVARTLLSRHLDPSDPAAAFAASGGLAFICNGSRYVSPGLLEALCIQIPERIGQELISVAPKCADRWGFGDAFRQSLVWRTYAAFSDETRQALIEFLKSEHDLYDTLDVLLTVASLPEHPLNARFLDQRLGNDGMPDRDAAWSVYLHDAYGTNGAVDRLVDWAYSLKSSTAVDDEVVDLCAVALSWMLTTSNRFLRDRATTALVNLLTDRMEAVTRLVQRFADVDDLYVSERVYAVAYGVAMRCHDPVAVRTVATCVYESVFAAGSPPPHILLRDYARGVIERALYLGSELELVIDHVRPPYESAWPTIPSEDDIKTLRASWSEESRHGGGLEWARNRIASSVLNDDFASYVIGTNSSVSNWLSLTLDDPPWKPPPGPDDLLCSLVGEFSSDELAAWRDFEAADTAYAEVYWRFYSEWIARPEQGRGSRSLDPSAGNILAHWPEEARPPEVAALGTTREQAKSALEKVLSSEHATRLSEISSVRQNDDESRQPPRFELAQIQRYVLWRVFDLGWTTDRFGRFDRFAIGYHGREASKAERIGKKYQWIAYHEIMALISDRYQYREYFREDHGDQAYDGPWQGHFRDIDPSCTLRSVAGGTSWDGHAVSWWAPARYDSWGDPGAPRDWVLSHDDLPKIEDMLVVENTEDGSRWVNGQGFFLWKQRPPADRESSDVEGRELWYKCPGYLIQSSDARAFLRWAKDEDLLKNRTREACRTHEMFLGEHVWAPASRYFRQSYDDEIDHGPPRGGCPVRLRSLTHAYLRGAGSFDCSVDESYKLRLPIAELVTGLGIRWSGRGGDFTDATNRVVAQDPAAHSDGPGALLIREDLLGEYLAREQLTICWVVVGEKRVIPAGFDTDPHYPWLRMSGAYVLADGHVQGFRRLIIDDPNGTG